MVSKMLGFGFYPESLQIAAGPIIVADLPELEEKTSQVRRLALIEKNWIYAPPQVMRDFMSRTTRDMPYASRIVGLPKTHTIEHILNPADDRLDFHLWSLSFFTGMRLTSFEAGFLDATPLKPGTLVDFILLKGSLQRSVELAEAFWNANAHDSRCAQRFAAAVYALFLGQNPLNLQFEQFLYRYTALDACYALAKALRPPTKSLKHSERIAWMCKPFGIACPAWADPNASGSTAVAAIRNDMLHEALFLDQPLGFAARRAGIKGNIILEMKALICRLLVALIGGGCATYVCSPINTRSYHGLELP